MKRYLKPFIASLFVAAVSLAATPAEAGPKKRQKNQVRRIKNGAQSGQLTKRETARLAKQQVRVRRMGKRAQRDGVVTQRERARINKAQNRASRNIFKKKHNRRSR